MPEHGPIYGVELLTVLPLDGGMKQALPSRLDLECVREISERTVAGFEVLTEHYRRVVVERNELKRLLEVSNQDIVDRVDRS